MISELIAFYIEITVFVSTLTSTLFYTVHGSTTLYLKTRRVMFDNWVAVLTGGRAFHHHHHHRENV